MKLAVIFPGIGYHGDKPLLYYSKKIAAEQDYKIKEVPYGGFPKGVKGSAKKMEAAFYSALTQSEEILSDVKFKKYEDILFISKSIGAAVAAAYGEKHGLKTRNIYFTPVEQSFQLIRQPGIVFHGTADAWVETEIVRRECERLDLPLYVTENANHSMETGKASADLINLAGIMEIVEKYITMANGKIFP